MDNFGGGYCFELGEFQNLMFHKMVSVKSFSSNHTGLINFDSFTDLSALCGVPM